MMPSLIRSTLSLARITVAEALRDRILYGLLLFGIGLVLLSAVLSGLTVGYRLRIVTDVSITGVNFAGLTMVSLLGVSAISRELSGRLVYPLIAKPIQRYTYILGKFAGVVATTWVNATLMMGAAAATIALYASMEEGGRLFTWGDLALSYALLLVRLGLVAAIAVSLSTFVSSTVALIGTIGFVVAGYLSSDLRFFMGQSESPGIRALGETLYYSLPDLSLLDPLGQLVHGQPILTDQVMLSVFYAIAYAVVLLAIAIAIFSKRDLA